MQWTALAFIFWRPHETIARERIPSLDQSGGENEGVPAKRKGASPLLLTRHCRSR